jgi:hypothetical protein
LVQNRLPDERDHARAHSSGSQIGELEVAEVMIAQSLPPGQCAATAGHRRAPPAALGRAPGTAGSSVGSCQSARAFSPCPAPLSLSPRRPWCRLQRYHTLGPAREVGFAAAVRRGVCREGTTRLRSLPIFPAHGAAAPLPAAQRHVVRRSGRMITAGDAMLAVCHACFLCARS